MMDINKLFEQVHNTKKIFNILPKKSCVFILKDFEKPLRRKKYQKTPYIYYECVFLEVDGLKQFYGRYSIQLPLKTAWSQLFEYLKENHRLKGKDICLKYVKLNEYHYCWSIANSSNYSITPITPLLYYGDYRNIKENVLRKDKGNDLGNVSGNDLGNVKEEDIEEF